jgi:hypothetical protein
LTDTAIKAKAGLKPIKDKSPIRRMAPTMVDEKGLIPAELAPTGGKLVANEIPSSTGKRNVIVLSVDTPMYQPRFKAREKRDEARRLLADGIDPSEHRKAHKATRAEVAGNTFEAIGREWYSKELPLWAPAQAGQGEGNIREESLSVAWESPDYGNQSRPNS